MFSLKNLFFLDKAETPFYAILLAVIFTAEHSVIAYGLLGIVIDIFSGVE